MRFYPHQLEADAFLSKPIDLVPNEDPQVGVGFSQPVQPAKLL